MGLMNNPGIFCGWREYFAELREDYFRQPAATQVLLGVVIVASTWSFLFSSLRWTLAHHHQDFDGYFVASSILRHGGDPYDYSQVEAATPKLGAELPQAMTSPVTLPLLFIPFTFLSLAAAGHVWDFFIVLCQAAAIALLCRMYCRTIMACAMVVFLGAGSSAYILSLSLGQISPFIFLLVVLATAFGEAGQYKRAAVFIAIASAIKIYPLALFGVFLWRDPRALAFGVGLTIVLLTAPMMLVPHSIYAESIRMVASQAGNVNTWGQNQSIAAMWYRLLTRGEFYVGIMDSPGLANLVYRISMVLGGLIWLVACYLGGRSGRFGTVFGYTILTGLLFPALTWEHYLVLALVPIVVLLCCDEARMNLSRPVYGGSLVAIALVCLPFDYLRVPLARGIFTLFISLKTLGLIWLWLVFTGVNLKHRAVGAVATGGRGPMAPDRPAEG
ncbi:MAG: DUF2029 domain-containing protein [Planctomycetota bacterium]|nr:DUF2029 domain-containing protein [Planctomycetota bacterium]